MPKYVDVGKIRFEPDEHGVANGVYVTGREQGKTMRFILTALRKMVEGLPSEDVEPVVHGRWIDHGYGIECSVCGFECNDEFYLGERKGCPNCRAKMDLEV